MNKVFQGSLFVTLSLCFGLSLNAIDDNNIEKIQEESNTIEMQDDILDEQRKPYIIPRIHTLQLLSVLEEMKPYLKRVLDHSKFEAYCKNLELFTQLIKNHIVPEILENDGFSNLIAREWLSKTVELPTSIEDLGTRYVFRLNRYMGYIKDEVVEIDLGGYRKRDYIVTEKGFKKEFLYFADKLERWGKRKSPNIVAYINHRKKEVLRDGLKELKGK